VNIIGKHHRKVTVGTASTSVAAGINSINRSSRSSGKRHLHQAVVSL
jgi:hypothetical protein